MILKVNKDLIGWIFKIIGSVQYEWMIIWYNYIYFVLKTSSILSKEYILIEIAFKKNIRFSRWSNKLIHKS